MSKTPLVYKSTHRIKFSELDPYDHMHTSVYSSYYVEHRMNGLREQIGWDLKTLEQLPFIVWVKKMEVDFLRPVVGDQEIAITSYVREFRGSDAYIECSMMDESGKTVSRCLMVVACVDKSTKRAKDWPADTMGLFFETGKDWRPVLSSTRVDAR